MAAISGRCRDVCLTATDSSCYAVIRLVGIAVEEVGAWEFGEVADELGGATFGRSVLFSPLPSRRGLRGLCRRRHRPPAPQRMGTTSSGATNNPATFEPWGARAEVLRPDAPSLCGTGPNGGEDSSVWVMLAGDGNGNQYAQIGYIWKNYGSGANRFFWEWSEGAGNDEFSQEFWGEATAGQTYDMRASYYPSDGYIHLILDGAQPACIDGQCAQTQIDPFTTAAAKQGECQAA